MGKEAKMDKLLDDKAPATGLVEDSATGGGILVDFKIIKTVKNVVKDKRAVKEVECKVDERKKGASAKNMQADLAARIAKLSKKGIAGMKVVVSKPKIQVKEEKKIVKKVIKKVVSVPAKEGVKFRPTKVVKKPEKKLRSAMNNKYTPKNAIV